MRAEAPGEPLARDIHQFLHVGGLGFDAERPGLEPRHVEEISDEAVEPLRLVADGGQKLVGLRRVVQLAVGQERGGRAEDRGQGRAQIVRQRGQHGDAQLVSLEVHLRLVDPLDELGALDGERRLVDQRVQEAGAPPA